MSDLQLAPPTDGAAAHPPPRFFVLTEHRLAEQFAAQHADTLRYDHQQRQWVIFDGHRWHPDRDGHIYRLAVDFLHRLEAEALSMPPGGSTREHAVKMLLRAESKSGMEHVIIHAQHIQPLSDRCLWDANPFLLGTPNGVLDLASGELRKGTPGDYITKAVSVPYDPTATCPRWIQFLEEVFNTQRDLIDWVQRFVGYSITGSQREQVLALLYGLRTAE